MQIGLSINTGLAHDRFELCSSGMARDFQQRTCLIDVESAHQEACQTVFCGRQLVHDGQALLIQPGRASRVQKKAEDSWVQGAADVKTGLGSLGLCHHQARAGIAKPQGLGHGMVFGEPPGHGPEAIGVPSRKQAKVASLQPKAVRMRSECFFSCGVHPLHPKLSIHMPDPEWQLIQSMARLAQSLVKISHQMGEPCYPP